MRLARTQQPTLSTQHFLMDLRTPENMLPDEVVGEDELVPADDAIIGRAFRWSLLAFMAIGGVIAAMVLIMRQPDQKVAAAPREFVPPKAIESSVTAPAIPFTDITRQSGIDFVHVNGATGDKLLPETMGGGAAFLDFDNDGDQDILLVNSCAWDKTELPPAISGAPDHDHAPASLAASHPTHALYRNNGDATFTNITPDSGLDKTFYGMGVAVGDCDNDGHTDIFISALGPNHLYRNLGNGTFEDVTEKAGVAGAPDAWRTSSGFIVIDNDGDLDLFVCNYVKWSRDIDFAVNYTLTGLGRAYGPPTNFEGVNSYLYRNNGDGTFSDISKDAGIEVSAVLDQPMGKALGLAPCDVDGDGLVDLTIANDTVRRFFFHNLGNDKFKECGRDNGLAFDRHGSATGAMGIDAAQYRNDGTLGFVIGNVANEMSSLMVSNDARHSQFVDEAITEGIGAPTRLKLKFGTLFFDADLDGRLDMLHANGHIEDDIAKVQESQTYRQSAQLFWNAGPTAPACFVEAASATLGDLPKPIVGRGASYADVDNYGDLDVLLTQVNGPPMLLRNETIAASATPGSNQSHWVRVKLVGNGMTVNRDAIGAVVELTSTGVTQTRTVMPTRSYLSQVELPISFGLGESTGVESFRVIWPDGSRSEHPLAAVDQLMVVEQK